MIFKFLFSVLIMGISQRDSVTLSSRSEAAAQLFRPPDEGRDHLQNDQRYRKRLLRPAGQHPHGRDQQHQGGGQPCDDALHRQPDQIRARLRAQHPRRHVIFVPGRHDTALAQHDTVRHGGGRRRVHRPAVHGRPGAGHTAGRRADDHDRDHRPQAQLPQGPALYPQGVLQDLQGRVPGPDDLPDHRGRRHLRLVHRHRIRGCGCGVRLYHHLLRVPLGYGEGHAGNS